MTSNSQSALELKSVTRRFGDAVAIRDLSLTVQPGEIVCLVGHSGCGKSSLLRIIAGVDVPDMGTVLKNGEEVAGPSRFVQPEARNIGFMFQDYALFPHLTVEANILFGLKKIPKQEARTRVKELMARVGVTALADRYPHMISGGEQQRVALARALAPNPDILLMDEPFSNLDRGLREKVRSDTIALLRSLGTTAVIVTHDPEEALSSGDKVVLMRSGEIVQAGTSYQLYDHPNCRYSAEFFTGYNKLPGVIRAGRIETALGNFAVQSDLPEESSAVAFIRPNDIELVESNEPAMGTVSRRALMGEIEQLTIQVAALTEPLQVRSTRRLSSDAHHVAVTVPGNRVLAFASDKAS